MSAIGVIWFISGVIGAVVIWRVDKHVLNRDRTWCPTPRAILGVLVGSVFGFIILGASIVIAIIEWLTNMRRADSWFTRPICERKEDR